MVAVIRIQRNALILAILFFLTTAVVAQDTMPPGPQGGPETGDAGLQKDVQNPVASLTLVPFQNNTNFDSGPFNRTQNVLDIQPVIPVNISSYWKVIVRIVQPVTWQPYPNQNTGGEYGFGDMAPDFFFSPRHPGKLMWGVGPAFAIPTALSTIPVAKVRRLRQKYKHETVLFVRKPGLCLGGTPVGLARLHHSLISSCSKVLCG
jgi:hypothetical protein